MGQAGPASAGLVPNGFEPRVEGLNEHTLVWVFEDVGGSFLVLKSVV